MFQIKYRVKPIHSILNDEREEFFAVQKKVIIWWTIKYFKTYKAADLWIDINILGKKVDE